MASLSLSSRDIENLSRTRTIVRINSNIYDVTDFLQDHPGGEDVIYNYNSKDVSEVMRDEQSHVHSEAAYEVLEQYMIGFNGNSGPVYEATGLSCEQDLFVDTDPKEDFNRHHFLNLEHPLLPQLWNSKFSKEFYLAQVHRPRYVAGGASAPLMPYSWIEPLSKTPWWIVPTIWIPCVFCAIYEACSGLSFGLFLFTFFCGLIIWTLIDFLFHIDNKMPDSPLFLSLHFLLHGVHHYLPMDRLRLVMPPALFVVLAAPLVSLAHKLLPYYAAWALVAGSVSGYIAYDLTHYFLHHKNLPAYWREMKTYHLAHHYKNWELGYGVTSKFWDYIFGEAAKGTMLITGTVLELSGGKFKN